MINGVRNDNLKLLTISQYIAALLVIIIHSGSLNGNPEWDFFIKNIICRLAVPFFMISTAYLYRQKMMNSESYKKKYFKKQLKTHAFWSIIYLPAGVIYLWQQASQWFVYPVALLVGVVYVGTWYHLWYLPALLFGIWFTDWCLRKFGYKITTVLAVICFIMGSAETYSSYIGDSIFGEVYQMYANIFVTTRNGLFFAFVFVLLGFVLSDFRNSKLFTANLPLKFMLSFIILSQEGWYIFQNPGVDKNFLFGLVPTSLFLVTLVLNSKIKIKFPITMLRDQARYLFFLHPLFLETSRYSIERYTGKGFEGWGLFIITFVLTSIISSVIIIIKNKWSHPKKISYPRQVAIQK